MWYDVDKTLSKGCLFNFILGNRGSGKTYGSLKRAGTNFFKKGEQFIYLRRYDSELDKVKQTIFSKLNINQEFPEDIEYCRSGYYRVKKQDKEDPDEVIGWPMALSVSADFKSASYPDVSLIIFDEFIIDVGIKHYIKNEVEMFLDFYETIARMRDVKVLFLSNSISFYNPYTAFFDLKLPYGRNWIRKNDLLLELVQDAEFIEEKKKTRFGKLIEGTSYADYAIDNKFLRDDSTFLEKKRGNCTCRFIMVYKDTEMGVWYNYELGKIYVSEDIDPYCGIRYTLTVEDHTVNTLLVKGSKSSMLKNFADNYCMGNVYFETGRVKAMVYEIIKLLI